jgi:hypothetical protein
MKEVNLLRPEIINKKIFRNKGLAFKILSFFRNLLQKSS